MLTKTFQGSIELKAAGKPGEFRAVFCTFSVIDKDGDVIMPGAFKDGQRIRVASWGHKWEALPVGVGVIHADDKKAWVDGRFFLDTETGRETYQTVKNLSEADLQDWSFGFDVLDSAPGTFEGRRVRFIKAIECFEVSPVLLGAGIGTHTEQIKSAGRGNGPAAVLRELDSLGAGRGKSPAAVLAKVKGELDLDRLFKKLDEMEAQLTEMEIAQLEDELAVMLPRRTNRDALRAQVIAAHGSDNSPAWIEAMLEGFIADLVERDYQRQELQAGVSPNRVVAMERVNAWLRRPAPASMG